MKKILSTLAVISMLSVGSIANAAAPISIFVKDKEIQSTVAPILEEGRVLVPIRVIAESLGAKVTWEQKNNTVTIRKWSESVILTLGKKTATRDGKADESKMITLDVSVKKENNRIYVPLRFLSQQYGYNVDWNGKSVFITSPLSTKERTTLYKGSLKEARTLAKDLMGTSNVHYMNKPLVVTKDGEYHSKTYIFPEGEALRCYVLQGDTVSLYEFKEDFPIVTWQAHLQKGDPLQQFINKKFTAQKGNTPKIDKEFLYYETGGSGDRLSEESGRIDLKGIKTQLGSKNSLSGEENDGNISLVLPNEDRNELNRDIS